MLTKKDFKILAIEIKHLLSELSKEGLTEKEEGLILAHITKFCSMQNKRFNESKFLEAVKR